MLDGSWAPSRSTGSSNPKGRTRSSTPWGFFRRRRPTTGRDTARGWSRAPSTRRPAELVLAIQSLPGAHPPPHHPGRHVRGRPQAAQHAELEHDHERDVAREPRGRRGPAGGGGLRHVHAPARGPRRLEHAAARRPVGSDVPERHLRLRAEGIRLLGDAARPAPRTRAGPTASFPSSRPAARPWWPTTSRSTTRSGSSRRRATRPITWPSTSSRTAPRRSSPAI